MCLTSLWEDIAMGQNTAWTWKDLSVDLFWSQKLGPLTHIAMKESLSHRQKQHIFLPQFLLESSSGYCLEIVEINENTEKTFLFCLENTKKSYRNGSGDVFFYMFMFFVFLDTNQTHNVTVKGNAIEFCFKITS